MLRPHWRGGDSLMTIKSRNSLYFPNAIRRSVAKLCGGGRYILSGFPAAQIPAGRVLASISGTSATSRVGTLAVTAETPSLFRGNDYFIDAHGTELSTHKANPFWNWTQGPIFGVGDFDWVLVQNPMYIQNNLGEDGMPEFRVVNTTDNQTSYYGDRIITEDTTFSTRVFVPHVTNASASVTLRGDSQINEIRIRIRSGAGTEYVQVQSVIGGSFTPIDQSPNGSVVGGREHLLEIDYIGDTVYVYVDNVLMFPGGTVLPAMPGDKFGIRADTTGCYFKDFQVRPYQAVNRRYIANDGNDATGDGSFDLPWATLDKVETEVLTNNAGYRYCFKKGDRFEGFLRLDAGGTGTDWLYCDALEISSYGPDMSEKESQITRLSIVSSGAWAGPDGNGEYIMSGQAQNRMFLVEDDVRLNGTGSATAGSLPASYIPQPGSLEPGEWALNEASNVLHYKPSTGGPSDHVVEMCSGTQQCLEANGGFTFIGDLLLRGASGAAGIATFMSGANYTWFHHITAKHGIRGLIHGSEGIQNHWRQTENDVSSMVWRACSTSSAGIDSAAPWGYVGLCYIHDLFANSADWGDFEPIMFGPGDNHGIVEFNRIARVGYADPTLAIPEEGASTMHPSAILSDSADNIVIRYNSIDHIALEGLRIGGREDQAITAGHVYNNVMVDVGWDTGTRGLHLMLGVIASNDVPNDRVVMEYNSLISCKGNAAQVADGMFCSISNKATDVTNIKYTSNLSADFTGALFIRMNVSLGSPLFTPFHDRNIYHRSDAQTTAAKSEDTSYSMTNFIGCAGSGCWQVDENQDPNSLLTDPLLIDIPGGDYRPASNSPAVGLGSAPVFQEGLDFYLNPRTGNTAGAIEAAPP